jgi:hypothetical protein
MHNIEMKLKGVEEIKSLSLAQILFRLELVVTIKLLVMFAEL